jgi:5-methylcytosine-specific restriction endonuclease McrA
MSARNGKPCKKCGSNKWSKDGNCILCDRERSRKWSEANPNRVKERGRKWAAENLGRRAVYDRKRYADNPEKKRKRNSAWQSANRETSNAAEHRRRTRKTAAGGSYTTSEWKALVNHYGNKCLRCGREDVKLTADHVVPVAKGGTSDIDNIQPLCYSCNSSKGAKTIDYRPDAGIGRWIQRKLFG